MNQLQIITFNVKQGAGKKKKQCTFPDFLHTAFTDCILFLNFKK